jgi:hypothetical protein
MQFASAISHEAETEVAIDKAVEALTEQLADTPVDLGFVFASSHHLKA